MVQEWVSTPIDCEASWIGLILDEQAAPDKGTRAEWVERAIKSVTDSFVAHRPDRKSSGTGLGSEDQTDARLGERHGASPPPTQVGPMRAISEAPAVRVGEGASPSARGREKEKAKVHVTGSHEEVRQLTPPHIFSLRSRTNHYVNRTTLFPPSITHCSSIRDFLLDCRRSIFEDHSDEQLLVGMNPCRGVFHT